MSGQSVRNKRYEVNAKTAVADFWSREACGERYGVAQEEVRYRLEPEIISFADFASTSGQRVLEIGVGMGSDFLNFIRAGAIATGVDLTERAVNITRERLQREGLTADVRIADAENLPFEDNSFDLVYSWGVLHHTPATRTAMHEAQRLLAPGGHLKVMLYHRISWVGLAAWIRFCLLRGKPFLGLRRGIGQIESPGTQAFTRSEVFEMLDSVDEIDVTAKLTYWDRRLAPGLARLLGNRLGWFLLVQARKPTQRGAG